MILVAVGLMPEFKSLEPDARPEPDKLAGSNGFLATAKGDLEPSPGAAARGIRAHENTKSGSTAEELPPAYSYLKGRILSVVEEPACHPNMVNRITISEEVFRFPYVRTVEFVIKDEAAKTEAIRQRYSAVADQVLVQAKPGVTKEQVGRLADGLDRVSRIETIGPDLYTVGFGSRDTDVVPNAIALFNKAAAFLEFAEPDYLVNNDSGSTASRSGKFQCRNVGSGTVSTVARSIYSALANGLPVAQNKWNVGMPSRVLSSVLAAARAGVGRRNAPAVYSTDFDTPPPGWNFDAAIHGVAWAVDGTPADFPNGVSRSGSSLNYNNGIDYLGDNRGGALSPAIQISDVANPVLKFWSNYQTETRTPAKDRRFVQIWDAAGNTMLAEWQLATNGYSFIPDGSLLGIGPGPSGDAYIDLETGTSVSAWHRHILYLDPNWGTIRIRFYFDSVDAIRNHYAGWAIDDLSVESHPTAPPTGWPDLFPDQLTSSGFNHTARKGSQLHWSWSTINKGSPGVHFIIGTHPQAQMDESFMFFHDAHGHYHLSQYADFSLWKQQPGVGLVKVRRGPKRSFCLVDVNSYEPGFPSITPGCGGSWQAISYNWQDVYSIGTPGQFMDASGLATDTDYYLVGIADPLNRIRELNDDNNVDYIHFDLPPGTSAVNIHGRSIPYPPVANALTIQSASKGTFNGKPAVKVVGSGFDVTLVPILFDVEKDVSEAPFYTLVSDTEIQVTIPDGIAEPAAIDLLKSTGDTASYRIIQDAYVSKQSPGIDDDGLGSSSGNGDGVINPGERIEMSVALVNLGGAAATHVSGDLASATADPHVSVTTSRVNYGTMAAGVRLSGLSTYVFNVSPSTPTPHSVSFNLTVQEDGGGSWVHSFDLIVYTSSTISGKVTRAGTGAALQGAVVSHSGSPLGVGSVTSQADGSFSFLAIDGTYTLKVSAVGLLDSPPLTVTVPPVVSNADFALGRSEVAVTPSDIKESLAFGASSGKSLTLANSGDVALDFTILANGYRNVDSRTAEGPSYQWIEISESGTPISGLGDHTNVGPFPIGFDFPFFEQTFTTFRVCSNGYLSFTDTASASVTQALPDRFAPRSMVAFCWDDLDFLQGGSAYYRQMDAGTLVVQFKDVPFKANARVSKLSAQVVLKSSGEILFQYQRVDQSNTSTVGIQNESRDEGLQIIRNQPYLRSDFAIRIEQAYGAPWLSFSTPSGSIAAGTQMDLTLNLRAGGLLPGTYQAKLGVSSNDLNNPILDVPITMTIENAPPVIQSGPLAEPQIVKAGKPVHFSVRAAEPEQGDLSYSWTFGDGSVGMGPSLDHVYTEVGSYTVRVTVSDGLDSVDRTITVMVVKNVLPQAEARADVTRGEVPLAVAFSSQAWDADGDLLAYTWNFGDGTTSFEVNPIHVYEQAGIYTVIVTVNDGLDSVTSSVLIDAVAIGGTLGEEQNPYAFEIKSLMARFRFLTDGKDLFRTAGMLNNLPEDFDPAGARITMDLAGVLVEFELDSRGRAKGPSGLFVLNRRRGAWSFATVSRRGSWARIWSAAGLNNDTRQKVTRELSLQISVGPFHFSQKATVLYSAQRDTWGEVRGPR